MRGADELNRAGSRCYETIEGAISRLWLEDERAGFAAAEYWSLVEAGAHLE